MSRLVDASGVALVAVRPPRRIVSLIPSTTETLCTLGLADALVGVTVYCREPADVVASKTRVGGEKTPDLEKIRALAPDLVVANIEENVREHIDTLIADIRRYRDRVEPAALRAAPAAPMEGPAGSDIPST